MDSGEPQTAARSGQTGPSFSRIASFWPLVAAAHRAAQRHLGNPEVSDFMLQLEPHVLELERELLAGTYQPGP